MHIYGHTLTEANRRMHNNHVLCALLHTHCDAETVYSAHVSGFDQSNSVPTILPENVVKIVLHSVVREKKKQKQKQNIFIEREKLPTHY